MTWVIVVGVVALIVVMLELLLSGPSVFVINDPRTLRDSLRVLVARGKHLASFSIETKSPKSLLRVQKYVERKKRISFAITADDPSRETEVRQSPARRLCDTQYPCLESGIDQVADCLRLALDEAHTSGGGTLPIRGEGSLSGILAFNVSQATGVASTI